MKSDHQVKIGVMLSYVLIILNTVYGLLITPYMIGQLGTSEYGVYKTISSLSSSLMVLDLGIGSTVMRFVAKYRAIKDEISIPCKTNIVFIDPAYYGRQQGILRKISVKLCNACVEGALRMSEEVNWKTDFQKLIRAERALCGEA